MGEVRLRVGGGARVGEVRLRVLRSEEAVAASRVVVEVGEAVGCVGGGCVDEEAVACC